MGPRSCSLYLYEDPWRASTLFLAFVQLLLTVLVLVHTVIVCITCQLMRWYGWGYPSCHDGIYHRDATVSSNSGVAKRPFNLDSNGSRSTPLISTEVFLKRSRSENWRAAKSRSFMCPKCYGVWNLKQGLSFRYEKGATSQLRETRASSDADNLSIGRASLVEAGTKNIAEDGSSTCSDDRLASCWISCFETSGFTQKFLKSGVAGKACDGAHEAVDGRLHLEDNCDIAGDTESCLSTPVNNLPRCVKEVATEVNVSRETGEEDLCSSSKEPRRNGVSTVPPKSQVNLQSPESTLLVQKEIQEEIADEGFSAIPRKKDDKKKCSFESVIKASWDEQISAFKDDHKGYDGESVIKGLKEVILKERKELGTLYAELEIERISSETATNEAMSMISRLQEDKAALRMQAAHYRRIAEERAIYDEQAMQLLRDILVKKEKENFLLEKEVKAMRTRCCRDVRIFGKKRQGIDRKSLSSVCQGMLLCKNVGDIDEVHLPRGKSEGSGEELPCLSPITEKQPFKRLKGNMDHENFLSLSLLLESGVSARTQISLSGGNESHALDPYFSSKCEHSGTDMKKNNCEEVFDNGVVVQEKGTVSEGKHVLSQNEKLLDASENRNESSEGLLKGSSIVSTAAESVQRWTPCLSDSSNNQALFPQVVEAANEGNQFGNCSSRERELVYLDNGLILGPNTFAPCYSDEVTSSVTACAEEARGLASSDVLQSPNMVWECNMRKDLQARGQIFQVDRLPQSCLSSLNQKSNLEENDSSLLRRHLH